MRAIAAPTSLSSAPRPRRSTRRARGLGLVEVMICASISALLLTAVSLAFRSSFNSYKDAQQRGQLLNAGRDFMYHLISDIRMADAAAPYDPTPSVCANEQAEFAGQSVPGNPNAGPPSANGSGVIGIQLFKTHPDSLDPTAGPTNPVTITYWFDAPTSQVFMSRQTGSGPVATSVACTFAQSFTVYLQPIYIPSNTQTNSPATVALLRAVVTTTLANKNASGDRLLTDAGQDQTLILTDSATPRRTFGGS